MRFQTSLPVGLLPGLLYTSGVSESPRELKAVVFSLSLLRGKGKKSKAVAVWNIFLLGSFRFDSFGMLSSLDSSDLYEWLLDVSYGAFKSSFNHFFFPTTWLGIQLDQPRYPFQTECPFHVEKNHNPFLVGCSLGKMLWVLNWGVEQKGNISVWLWRLLLLKFSLLKL